MKDVEQNAKRWLDQECLPIYSVKELANMCRKYEAGFKKVMEYERALL